MRNNTSPFPKCACRHNWLATGLAFASLVFTAAAQTNDIKPVTLEALPLPLDAVRLTGGPLAHAQQLDAKYLLELDPDKMLFYLRQRAGLTNKTDSGYPGWDGAGRQLTGHIAGHYLSAVSYMYAATGDAKFKERADYIVSELKEVQDKQRDGYIGALMGNAPRGRGAGARGTNAAAGGTNATAGGARRGRGPAEVVDGKGLFEEITNGVIQSGGFDLNGMWSPWYVEHKLFAGLRDAYHYTGNKDALAVEIKFAAWVESIVGNLTEAQLQGAPGVNGGRRIPGMLDTEFGGMNEVLADLYHDTGDLRWLALSDRFEHKAIVNPLAAHNDILGGKHGNTTIPKMLGELSRYVYTGNKTDGDAAEFFWDQVVFHHSYATGGHGHNEYFEAADQLDRQERDGTREVDGRDDESCNVYNMLKMSRELFSVQPDVKYAEFMERALYNHVLGSIDPNNGWMCYMVPVGHGVTHEYQDMFRDFTCCVGTGMENHALHGYGIYYQTPDQSKLWVNFYTPNTAEWKEGGAKLDMQTSLPEGDDASLTLTLDSPKEFTLALRRPSWAGEGFSVKVNGEAVTDLSKPESYVEIKRTWKSGDTVALVLPKVLHEESLPDDTNCVALMWGPLVLAGDLGPENRRRGASNDVPVLVSGDTPIQQWLQPASGKSGEFNTVGVGHDKEVHLVPFYRLPERTYAIYWDTFTKASWKVNSPEYAAEQARLEKLKLGTVSYVQPGQMQAERDANMQASAPEDSTVEQTLEHFGRRGTKWFSFDIAVDPAHPMTLACTYYANEANKRTFDVLVDGQKIGDETIPAHSGTKFYDVNYKIPAELVSGKSKVTVRFQATQGNEVGAVYGLRTLRADTMQ